MFKFVRKLAKKYKFYVNYASDDQQMGGSMETFTKIQVSRCKMVIPCLDHPSRTEATHFAIVTWMGCDTSGKSYKRITPEKCSQCKAYVLPFNA